MGWIWLEYANDLYQDGRMGTGHIVTDLIVYDVTPREEKRILLSYQIL